MLSANETNAVDEARQFDRARWVANSATSAGGAGPSTARYANPSQRGLRPGNELAPFLVDRGITGLALSGLLGALENRSIRPLSLAHLWFEQIGSSSVAVGTEVGTDYRRYFTVDLSTRTVKPLVDAYEVDRFDDMPRDVSTDLAWLLGRSDVSVTDSAPYLALVQSGVDGFSAVGRITREKRYGFTERHIRVLGKRDDQFTWIFEVDARGAQRL